MNEPKKGLRRWLGLIAFAGLTLGIVLYWKDVLGIISHISAVLRPILLAIVISFFVNLPMRIYERWFMHIFQKLRFRYKETLCRTAGMLLSFLTFIAVVVLAVSLLIFCVVVPQLRYIRWRYEVGQWELDIQKGIIWRTRIIVPFIRVQNTDTKQGPIQRALGLASVTVSTAAGSHEIPGLTADEADKLRDAIATQARLAQEDI